MVQQWDYRVEILQLQVGPMENALKQAGWDGWELVSVFYPQGTVGTAWAAPVAILRRPVTAETPMTPTRYK